MMLRRVLVGVAFALVLLPGRVRALERTSPPGRNAPRAKPAPPPPHRSSFEISRVRGGGMLLFSVSYGLALSLPIARGFDSGREWLAVPITGPIVALYRHVDPPWGIALSEIGQLVGTSLVVAGPSVSWGSTAFSPFASERTAGISAAGAF